MKKHINMTVVYFMVLFGLVLAGCHVRTSYIPQDLANINTAVNNYIHYTKDETGDYWQTPAETMLRAKGDCEDYTTLKAYYLSKYPMLIHYVTIGKSGHVLLEVHHPEGIYYLDNRYRYVLTAEHKLAIYGPSIYTWPVEEILSAKRRIHARNTNRR